jgi:hypothetical protein
MMADTSLNAEGSALPESRTRLRPRRPLAKLMFAMLIAKIAYDVAMRRWAATISSAEKP